MTDSLYNAPHGRRLPFTQEKAALWSQISITDFLFDMGRGDFSSRYCASCALSTISGAAFSRAVKLFFVVFDFACQIIFSMLLGLLQIEFHS